MVDARHGPGIKCSIRRQKKNQDQIEKFEKIRKKRKNKMRRKIQNPLNVNESLVTQPFQVPDFIDPSWWRR